MLVSTKDLPPAYIVKASTMNDSRKHIQQSSFFYSL